MALIAPAPVKCFGLIGENGVKKVGEFVQIKVGDQMVQFTPEAALDLAKQMSLAAAELM